MSWRGLLAFKGKTALAFWGLVFLLLTSWGILFAVQSNSWAENAIRLVRMEPKGEIKTKTNFTFIFSGNVVPKSQTGQFFTMDKIQFKPTVPGKYRWDNPKTLRFFPEVALRPSTAYTVELSADIASPLGKRLTGERTVKLTTERFKVVDQNLSFAYNPKQQRGLFFQARLNFNYPVSVAALQRSL
ncbi:MAG TPA: Ig-like domain-containing protein, partial [Bacillota bacterium]|nr:Ig-like domain-containing protein [Bacillota bacterium]